MQGGILRSIFLYRLPCARGAVSEADGGVVLLGSSKNNPSAATTLRHLPFLAKGRLNLCRLPCVKGAVCVSRLRDCLSFTTPPPRFHRDTSPYTGEALIKMLRHHLRGCSTQLPRRGGYFQMRPSYREANPTAHKKITQRGLREIRCFR